MPISVQYLHDFTKDLLAKDQAGWRTTDEFNRMLQAAEQTLFEFYYQQFEQSQKIVDAIVPFLVTTNLNLTNGVSPLPSNYWHRATVGYRWIKNQDCGDPIVEDIPVDYMQVNEVFDTLSNPIRKPSLPKKIVRHTFIGKDLYVYPIETKSVIFRYFRQPQYGLYSTTLVSTADGDFENYDANTSTDLEWGQQETQNLANLIMFMSGVEIKDSQVVEYAMAKSALNN
jgi:hypothetical protein